MARIIDLDLIAPTGVTIKKTINNVEHRYDLPGDVPSLMWLGLSNSYDMVITAAEGDRGDAVQDFHDRMLELFRLENDLDELPFSLTEMFQILRGFYDAEDEPDPPRPARRASATKTTRGRGNSAAATKPKTPSRSSR